MFPSKQCTVSKTQLIKVHYEQNSWIQMVNEVMLGASHYAPDYVHNFDFDLPASGCLPKYQIDFWIRMHYNWNESVIALV